MRHRSASIEQSRLSENECAAADRAGAPDAFRQFSDFANQPSVALGDLRSVAAHNNQSVDLRNSGPIAKLGERYCVDLNDCFGRDWTSCSRRDLGIVRKITSVTLARSTEDMQRSNQVEQDDA